MTRVIRRTYPTPAMMVLTTMVIASVLLGLGYCIAWLVHFLLVAGGLA